MGEEIQALIYLINKGKKIHRGKDIENTSIY